MTTTAFESIETLRADLARLRAESDAKIEALLARVAKIEAVLAVNVPFAERDIDERAHLAQYGEVGEVVARISEKRGVALRDLLGPGPARTAKASKARKEAARALYLPPVKSCARVAAVLRISPEAARLIIRDSAGASNRAPVTMVVEDNPPPTSKDRSKGPATPDNPQGWPVGNVAKQGDDPQGQRAVASRVSGSKHQQSREVKRHDAKQVDR
jgi:hypothetical protein